MSRDGVFSFFFSFCCCNIVLVSGIVIQCLVSKSKFYYKENTQKKHIVLISHLFSVLMSYENVELTFSDADRLPDLFRKSRKGSIYLTPYRVGISSLELTFLINSLPETYLFIIIYLFILAAVLEPKQALISIGVGDHSLI